MAPGYIKYQTMKKIIAKSFKMANTETISWIKDIAFIIILFTQFYLTILIFG